MEDLKRPNHNDFRDSSELAKEEFSGIRHNSISQYVEFWMIGEKKFEMPVHEFATNPEKWRQKMADCLGLHNVEFLPQQGEMQ